MENIPPTADALLQHARRAAYQASVWATSENTQQRRPTPESWGCPVKLTLTCSFPHKSQGLIDLPSNLTVNIQCA